MTDATTADPGRESDRRLQVLIADYEMARADERQHPVVIAGLFTILVAVVFAEASQVLGNCTGAGGCGEVPWTVFAIAPSPAYAVLAMTVLVGAEATMRYAYMVALEQEIERCGPDARLELLECPPLSWQRARAPLVIFGAGPARRFPFPFLYVLMLFPLVTIVVALSVFCIAQITPATVAVGVACLYGAASALLLYATVRAWRADLWQPWPWRSNGFVRAAMRRQQGK